MQFDMLLIPSANLTQIFAARKYRRLNQNLKRDGNAVLTITRPILLFLFKTKKTVVSAEIIV